MEEYSSKVDVGWCRSSREAQCKGYRFSMHSEEEAGAGGLSEDIEE